MIIVPLYRLNGSLKLTVDLFFYLELDLSCSRNRHMDNFAISNFFWNVFCPIPGLPDVRDDGPAARQTAGQKRAGPKLAPSDHRKTRAHKNTFYLSTGGTFVEFVGTPPVFVGIPPVAGTSDTVALSFAGTIEGFVGTPPEVVLFCHLPAGLLSSANECDGADTPIARNIVAARTITKTRCWTGPLIKFIVLTPQEIKYKFSLRVYSLRGLTSEGLTGIPPVDLFTYEGFTITPPV
jgi:hypothetical protein